MFKMLKKQKGMTLVELLAVMVIVGIIAAISIPAIGGLIENSRKDAVVSTATSLVEAARMYVAAEGINDEDGLTLTATGETTDDLVTSGYLEATPKDPKKQEYDEAKVEVTFTDNKATYKVTLNGSEDEKYDINEVEADKLDRKYVGS